MENRDARRESLRCRELSRRVARPVDAAVRPDEEQALHEQRGERVPIALGPVGRDRAARIGDEGIEEPLGEDAARIWPELEAVRVDDEWLAAADQDVEVVEIADGH